MARITVEDCLDKVPNRFELVLAAVQRAKQLLKGARPLVESDNKEICDRAARDRGRCGHINPGASLRVKPSASMDDPVWCATVESDDRESLVS